MIDIKNLPPEQIDLDANADAYVIGRIKTQDFLVIMGISAAAFFLYVILGFLPIWLRLPLFFIPVAAGFFFQVDGPTRLTIRREFAKREHEPAPGESLDAAYNWSEFETLKNYVVVDDHVLVFAALVLPPMALFSDDERQRLDEGFTAAIRTAMQAGAVFEQYMFHRAFVPGEVSQAERERYWMETGANRYTTEIYIRLVFAGTDVLRAETLSNRIRKAYFANGGRGEWVWASAGLCAQESHDALNPGALRKRYLEVVANANPRPRI